MPTPLNTPLSLYSIPVVWMVGIWPVRKRIGLINRTIGFDNTQPLGNIGRLCDYPGVSPAEIEAAERMEGAHLNSIEILPLWIGAVIAGTYAGLDDGLMNLASLAFIVTRVFYNSIHIHQSTKKQASWRSLTWMAGTAIPMTLFITAANKLRLGKLAK